MSIYETIKNQVTTRQAADRYGLKVGRNGMCKCPFHNDKNPSMKVDKRFHCFGCQADGDVISFTSRLFHIPPREAALKLADEFGIQHDQQKSEPYVRKHYQIKAEDILAHKISYCIRELTIYRNQLLMWKKQYTPQKADEDWHPLFLEALIHLDKVESSLDILLIYLSIFFRLKNIFYIFSYFISCCIYNIF